MLSNSNGVYFGSDWTWSGSGLKVKSTAVGTQSLLYQTNSPYTYSPDYTYIWTISVTGSFGSPEFNSLDFYEPWNNTNNPSFRYKISQPFFSENKNWSTNKPGDLIYMSSTLPFSTGNVELNSNFTSNIRLKIASRSSFGNVTHPDARFLKFNVKKTDWLIEGWAWRDDDTNEGWKWNSINNSLRFDYRKSQYVTSPPDIQTYHYSKADLSRINFCSKFVNFEKFNFSVNFEIQGDTSSYIKAYLIDNIKNVNPLTTTSLLASGNFESLFNTDYQYLGKLSETGTYSFYNLTGDQYLAFFAWYPTASTYGTYSLQLSDLKIEGGYSKSDNNSDFLLTTSNTYDQSTSLFLNGTGTNSSFDATATTPTTLHESGSLIFGVTGGTGTYSGFFSDLYGTVSNIASLRSKIGNGEFRSGVWENGVWNSGNRIDNSVKYFNTIESYLKINSQSTIWRIQLLGVTQSTSSINIGDDVSVSNIAVIDINDERRILTTKWRVININDKRLVLEAQSVFPIMRIEKDSENHKILVTKNIWLNGIFFNGIFSGVWNSGLVSGYPYITKFEKIHWLNGDFKGGHFLSRKEGFQFADTYYWEGYVGLTFGATAHSFDEGDIIEIDKDNKTINPAYDGLSKITKVVDDYLVITDKAWGLNTTAETGLVISQANGLIQNMNFDSLNVSKKTSKNTQVLKEIWKYNSWMDLNWGVESSTNINTDRTYFNNSPSQVGFFTELFDNNKFGLGEYSPLNLWGLTTDDVLKSESKFRNINNTLIKNYSLGTKWSIYEDYLGSISEFSETFGTSNEYGGLNNFLNNGWTFSYYSSLTTANPNIYRSIDGTFKYDGLDNDAGVLLLNNTNINTPKSRYSLIEFDYLSGPEHILAFSASGDEVIYDFHYLDLFNFPVFSITEGDSIKWSNIDAFPQEISPIYDSLSVYSKGINYEKGLKKREFFYNRLGLDLGLFSMGLATNGSNATIGSQSYHFELDNIKFYEVDMIPFFNYTTENYVNGDIQVPYFGISPQFSFSDDFNFLENTTLSLQGIILNKSDETITIPQLPNDGEADLLFR
jgi:hypothetical protein